MNDSQVLVLCGLICLAPHYHPIVGNMMGLLLIIFAAVKGLGWI